MCNDMQSAQHYLTKVEENCLDIGLKLNTKKTEYMNFHPYHIKCSKTKNENEKPNSTKQEHKKSSNCNICYCDECNKKNLNKHTDGIHKKVKDFECKLCHYTAYYSNNLEEHIAIVHDKIKHYQFPYCHFNTNKNLDLNKHIATTHVK